MTAPTPLRVQRVETLEELMALMEYLSEDLRWTPEFEEKFIGWYWVDQDRERLDGPFGSPEEARSSGSSAPGRRVNVYSYCDCPDPRPRPDAYAHLCSCGRVISPPEPLEVCGCGGMPGLLAADFMGSFVVGCMWCGRQTDHHKKPPEAYRDWNELCRKVSARKAAAVLRPKELCGTCQNPVQFRRTERHREGIVFLTAHRAFCGTCNTTTWFCGTHEEALESFRAGRTCKVQDAAASRGFKDPWGNPVHLGL